MTPLIAALVQIAREVAPSLACQGRGADFVRRLGVIAALRGSDTRTTVPLPSFERSRIEPPCRLVSDRAIASPSPEP